MNASPARRRQLLEAMGVTLYARRRLPLAGAGNEALSVSHEGNATGEVVVVVGRREDRAAADLLWRALSAGAARMHWIEATPEKLAALPPEALAFVALGAALARPLGAELSTELQQRAQIVITAAPAEWRGAAGKRALWQALKPLRRRLES